MFEKRKLKASIKKHMKEIERVEQRRSRSQAALVEAIITHSVPSDQDVDFFNRYTEQINKLRDEMSVMQEELEKQP